MRSAISIFLTLFGAASCVCQSSALLYKQPTVSLSFGAGIFHPPKGSTTFWNVGPGGSTRFMITVSKPVSIGIGVDAAFFSFDEQAFRNAYPTVPVRSKNMMMANVYLAMKCMVMPSMRLSPYVGLTLGATRLSEAIYGEVIDSVRVNYYNIPARTTPTFGISLGAGIYIVQWLSFDAEAKTNYVVNNPDLKAAFLFLGGFRFTL
ncbi:MAG: hypothetical protein HW412_2461 [Bacteroidetes bacterium]|nr:hypothetical protein [Bacteroidota bacterium]